MKTANRVAITLILIGLIGLLCSHPLEAAKLREKLKSFLLQRIDDKALDQPVESKLHYLSHGGYKRSYYLYVPDSWDKRSSLPVVFLFHGGGGGARGALYYYELEKKAEEAGFLLVSPNGTGESEHVLLTWNVIFGFGFAQKNNVDDIGFVNALLEYLEMKYPIDPKRIFATGLSNGAIFCHFLASQPGNRFAAIAPVVGTAGGKDQNEKDWHKPPTPQIPVSVCIIQGLIDKSVPITGGLQNRSMGEPKMMLSASDTIDFWVTANNCKPAASTSYNAKMKTTVHHFTDGANQSEVTAYILHNMGHAWPGSTRVPRKGSDAPSPDFPGNDIIWDFFKTHPRP